MAKEMHENSLFSKSKQKLGGEYPPTPEVVEPFLKKFDQKIERRPQKHEIIEKAEKKRIDFLENILQSRLVDVVGNLIPGIDIAKMTNEIIEGKTSSGVKLKAIDRVAYLLMVTGIAVFYLSLLADSLGSLDASDVGWGSRLGVAAISALEGLSLNQKNITELFQKVANRFPKAGNLFSGIGSFLQNDKRVFDNVDKIGVKEIFLNNLRRMAIHE